MRKICICYKIGDHASFTPWLFLCNWLIEQMAIEDDEIKNNNALHISCNFHLQRVIQIS